MGTDLTTCEPPDPARVPRQGSGSLLAVWRGSRDAVSDNPNPLLYSTRDSGPQKVWAMKFGVAILVIVVVLAGCSREGVPPIPAPTSPVAPAPPAPPAPPPPTAGSALLWMMVLADSGACIEGGTI
jgi:hypothetical protein